MFALGFDGAGSGSPQPESKAEYEIGSGLDNGGGGALLATLVRGAGAVVVVGWAGGSGVAQASFEPQASILDMEE